MRKQPDPAAAVPAVVAAAKILAAALLELLERMTPEELEQVEARCRELKKAPRP